MLDKISIRHAALSDRVVLARFGKDPQVALETRDAMSEFLQAPVSYAFGGKMPAPGELRQVEFGGGDEQFTVTIGRKPAPMKPGKEFPGNETFDDEPGRA